MSLAWDADHLTAHPRPRKSSMKTDTSKLVMVGGILLAAALVAYYLEKNGVPHVGPPSASPKPAAGGGGYRPPTVPAAAPRPQVPAYHAPAPASSGGGGSDADDEDDGDSGGSGYSSNVDGSGGSAFDHN